MNFFESLIGPALLGGVLIGLCIGALTVLTGRVTSGSKMIGSLLGGAEGVAATSIAFMGGIVATSLFMNALGFAPIQVVDTNWILLAVGGLLVGISARIGGASLGGVVTGIARRAPGSIVMLLCILAGATIGGILQIALGGGSAS